MQSEQLPRMVVFFLAAALAGGAAAAPASAVARSTLRRDVEGYAIAACLTKQTQPYLKDQGYKWAEVIVQGRSRDFETLKPLDGAVKLEVAKGDMAVVSDENSPTRDKALPMLYCGEIIDKPGVRVAIETAIRRLTLAHRRR